MTDDRSGGTNGTVDNRHRAGDQQGADGHDPHGDKDGRRKRSRHLTATAEDPDDGSIVSYLWTANPDVGTFGNIADQDHVDVDRAGQDGQRAADHAQADRHGQRGRDRLCGSVIMKVSGNDQPKVSIATPADTEVDGGAVVELSATASDPDEEDTHVSVDRSGTAFPTDSGTISHPYADPLTTPSWTAPAKTNAEQEVTLTLSVSDGTSTSSAQVTITVRANNAPTIDRDYPQCGPPWTGNPQSAVAVRSTSRATVTETDTGDDRSTYAWTADDGDANTADDGSFDPPVTPQTRPILRGRHRPRSTRIGQSASSLTVSDGLTEPHCFGGHHGHRQRNAGGRD